MRQALPGMTAGHDVRDEAEVRLASYGTQRRDAFEGRGYRRVAVDVSTAEGVLRASIYVLAVS